MTKEEKRARRRARRKERRERRRARRAARQAEKREHGGKLGQFVADKLRKVLDSEVTRLQVEAGELPATARPSNELMRSLTSQAHSALLQSNIPIFSKVANVVPDVLEGVRQQIRLAYSLSREHGYQGKVSPELLLYVMVESFGKKKFKSALGQIEQSRVKISEGNPQAIQQALLHMGGTIAGRLVKSVVAKWVPVLGTAVSVIWDQLMVSRIEKTTAKLFTNRKVEFTDQVAAGNNTDVVVEEDEEQEIDKLYTIVQLMQADKAVSPEERKLFEQMLENADIEKDEKKSVLEELDDFVEDPEDTDLSFYKNNEEEALLLLTDLIAMAQVDQRMSAAETFFISRIAQQINFPLDEVQTMIEAKPKA